VPVSWKNKRILSAAAGAALLAVLFAAFPALSCSSGSEGYLMEGIVKNKEEQRELLSLLSRNPTDSETRFALTNRIASNLLDEGLDEPLIMFLTSEVNANPDDPYAAYWLLLVAQAYLDQGANDMAGTYFARILENCPDLEVKGTSVHLACLQNLIRITETPDLLVRYYSDLITRFGSEINQGYAYFMLARSYERLGEWELAIQTYKQFLDYGQYAIQIPRVPDAYDYAKKIIDYDSSSKDWTFDTLDDLVAAITKAIRSYDSRSLDRYRAKVNFFAMSWKQDSSGSNAEADFAMRDFMVGNRIRCNDTLDSSSNPNEAYLRTWGWSQYVNVWYLYFRKVNFPADPDIHGRWEWAGIYYGEKL